MDTCGINIHPDTLRKGMLGLRWADDLGMIRDTQPEAGEVKEATDEANEILEDCRRTLWQARDERNAANSQRRVLARAERNMEILEERLNEIGARRYDFNPSAVSSNDFRSSEADLIISISDIHYGAKMYDAEDSEADRMQRYFDRILEIRKRHQAQNVHILLMGDLISGMIHRSIQVSNRENVITQVIQASELIADFLYALGQEFQNVNVYSVAGNHSRLDRKEDALLDDRLDDLICWYTKGVLRNQQNIQFHPSMPTMSKMRIRGRYYVAVHGDYDEFTDAGCAKLISYLGYCPDGIFYAHRHTAASREYNGVTQIQTGSMCGDGDDYALTKRLKSRSEQTVCVVDKDGIRCMYNVKLS